MKSIILFFFLLSSSITCAHLLSWGEEPLDDGARCDVNAVRRANREQLHLLLEELTNTTFFRLFRVGLDEGNCPQKAVEEGEMCGTIPVAVAAEGGGGMCTVLKEPEWSFHKQLVDTTISRTERSSLKKSDLSCEAPDFWFDMCDGLLNDDDSRGWINLQLNPERHTGYNGSEVWKSIYDQACLTTNSSLIENPDSSACPHEERVLQRLLSGLHASINTHIALYYYPPSSRTTPPTNYWKPNPTRFMETVGSHPTRLRNLNFAFVVLLRALRKATPVFSKLSFAVAEDPQEDFRTAALVRRLLDSHLMSSCSKVFDSFDESLMFNSTGKASDIKIEFKNAFLEISKIFDCVKCQKCRLHGKLQLTGIGTALKILLLPDHVLRDTPIEKLARREEIVALFNTLHKFSHAIASADILTELYFTNQKAETDKAEAAASAAAALSFKIAQDLPASSSSAAAATTPPLFTENHLVDSTIAVIARAGFQKLLSTNEERGLLSLIVDRQKEREFFALASLAKHYGSVDMEKFALFAKSMFAPSSLLSTTSSNPNKPIIVVVVGTGLAGSTATLSLLDSGKVDKVYLIEKQAFLGGNSVYASSGMNAVDQQARDGGDSVELFANDMAKSSGRGMDFAKDPLVQALTGESESALQWIRERAKQPFPSIGQLGGHSKPRTHRPEHGMAGAELVYALHRLMKKYQDDGTLVVLKSARVRSLQVRDLAGHLRQVTGVHVSFANGTDLAIADATAIVLATGGYAANHSLVPEWMRRFGTTNGPFASGDGLELVQSVGGDFVDLDKVQLHPTAFSSQDKSADDALVEARMQGAQPLCAEILRGVGGVLLDSQGKRFVDELGTRAFVSTKMIERYPAEDDFVILLSGNQAPKTSHVEHYVKRGLMKEFHNLKQVAEWMRLADSSTLHQTLTEYEHSALMKTDPFNKKTFPNVENFANSTRFFAGRVQPSLHYCMGGVRVDENAHVLNASKKKILGLYAIGELAGGVHGDNRLGGNGMTEGLVFGRRAARVVLEDANVKLVENESQAQTQAKRIETPATKTLQKIAASELARHSTAEDCWIAIKGKVYDFTSFLSEHPGGPKSVLDHAGKDATKIYEEIHSLAFLDDFVPVGELLA